MSAPAPENEAHATRRDDGALALSGALTFDTVPELYEHSAEWLQPSGGAVTVDLEEVRRVDSAGLALLVEWVRLAQTRGSSLKLMNVPEQLRSLIRVHGLSDALGVNNSR